ncbi:MAG: winged helix-turn-helix transcriptional regulator, partial [bacterium]|nr:winged helix-turn-helix transcriptional regulator [bacterium]
MALSANDPRPPYRQIADELIAQIANGEVAPGGKLPSARDLMQRYDVANQTVQSALRVLRTQGLINSVPG